jgi:hypothetical protein
MTETRQATEEEAKQTTSTVGLSCIPGPGPAGSEACPGGSGHESDARITLLGSTARSARMAPFVVDG